MSNAIMRCNDNYYALHDKFSTFEYSKLNKAFPQSIKQRVAQLLLYKARITPLTRCGSSNVPLCFLCRDWSCHGDYFLPDLYLLQRCYILESSVSISLLCFCCPVEVLWQFLEHCKLQVNNDNKIKVLPLVGKRRCLLNISISKQFLC